LFRNPLASPWTLGLVAGAQFGVATALVVAGFAGAGWLSAASAFGNISLAVAASIGSTLALFIIAGAAQRVTALTLLILGLMLHYFVDGLVNVVLHFTDIAQIRAYEAWNAGSFGGTTWGQVAVLAMAVFGGLVISAHTAKPLNALLIGEDYARTLGMAVRRTRLWIIGAMAIQAGAVTAYCGPIIFLGVAIPHICRGLFQTSDHRSLVPATVLAGSLLALGADLVTHLPWQTHVLHLNSVNALIGAPVVAWVLLRGEIRIASQR
jgi:iron complex transport system permease protein